MPTPDDIKRFFDDLDLIGYRLFLFVPMLTALALTIIGAYTRIGNAIRKQRSQRGTGMLVRHRLLPSTLKWYALRSCGREKHGKRLLG
jgi:hypothetical protein